jgi:hypothetical protein
MLRRTDLAGPKPLLLAWRADAMANLWGEREMNLSRSQIIAVLNSPIRQTALERPEDEAIARKSVEDFSADDWDALHDACMDALLNEAPIVSWFDAEQSKGAYGVSVRGVPGAYFVEAQEFDRVGLFDTQIEAENKADFEHGEFRVADEAEDGEAQASRKEGGT